MRGLIVLVAAVAAIIFTACSASSGSDSAAVPTTALPDTPVEISALVRGQFNQAVTAFQSWDPSFEAPDLLLLDSDSSRGGNSICGDVESGSAFYCDTDHKLVLSLGFVEDFARRSTVGELRDAAVFAIVAHELGHAWEQHVGYADPDPSSALDNELFADCIAGAVIAATYPGAEAGLQLIQQAAAEVYSVGDFTYTDPEFHGTPTQRRDAALRGGDGHQACDAYLRP